MTNNGIVDITPTPRILRTLGEIPFQTWQCIAELVDNSIDAFLSNEANAPEDYEKKITVSWTGDAVAAADRTVEITDNAYGMTIEQLQNAVRAGYTSNDPIGNLGLFGMGFNISTARLGELTKILSTQKGDPEWVGVEIDFQKLIDSKHFDAPIIREPKIDPSVSGTKVKVSHLKPGILSELPIKENDIRQRLEAIYSPLLNTKDIAIYVKGRRLMPRNLCVWSASRFVIYNSQNVSARVDIDRKLGDALFDLSKNAYLTADEAEKYYLDQQEGIDLPSNIVERSKRLTGWLGIQRYADPNDFGIDFIRNGRKILISDKSLFQYENPITGQKELQYPLELGTSIGGRIVGELHVDYLLPTYQKNDFDRADISWIHTIEAICGMGPFLPKSRKAMGFLDSNTSPLGMLVNAFRRVDKGTKCLFAPNEVAKNYAAQFKKNQRDYMDDTLWWKAAQEEDQKQNTGGMRSTEVNKGETPSDDIGSYFGTPDSGSTVNVGNLSSDQNASSTTASQQISPVSVAPETSILDELIQMSTKVTQMSGKQYRFGNLAPLNVQVYELNKGAIYLKGERKPTFFASDGIECDFVYDPTHSVLTQFPITPKMLLLQYLAEKLKARDNLADLVLVYSDLVESSMPEAKIDRQTLQDRASSAFELLRERLSVALKPRAVDVLKVVHEAVGDVEETLNSIQSNSALIKAFQSCTPEGFGAIDFVPQKTLVRLVEKFPEDVFDGKALSTLYLEIQLPDENATKRVRDESKERVISFLKDALRVATNSISGQREQKNELARASLSVDFLLKELET
ncbi:MAG: ATP-binding protein [Oscillospiraceae bacterium]|jgi:hypothetical protein|nr:ATP-binding protein [Oscillospiraceae bacterium]